jgi:hypothetical protein
MNNVAKRSQRVLFSEVFMGKKSIRNKPKRQFTRKNGNKTPKINSKIKWNSPFDNSYFWLNLATIDFSDFCGVEAHTNRTNPSQED